MASLCRLCASLRKNNILILINNENTDILNKIEKCCNIQIDFADPLPKAACQECMDVINNFYPFYQKVQEAQETLYALYPKAVSACNAADQTMLKVASMEEGLTNKNATKETYFENDALQTNINKLNTPVNEETTVTQIPQQYVLATEEASHQFETRMELEFDSKDLSTKITEDECVIIETIQDDLVNIVKDIFIPNEIYIENPSTFDNMECCPSENITTETDKNADVLSVLNVQDKHRDDDPKIIEEIQFGYIENINQTNCPALENNELLKPSSNLPPDLQKYSWKLYIFKCFACDYEATSFTALKEHAERLHDIIHMNNLQYKCYDCLKIMPHYNSFLNHVFAEEATKTTQHAIVSQIRSKHHPGLILRCDVCDTVFQNFEELGLHRRLVCTEAQDYPSALHCTMCYKTYNKVCNLQIHLKQIHETKAGDDGELYKCAYCGKEYNNAKACKVHEFMHKKEKTFTCDICNATFYTGAHLESHLYSHVDEKAYKCHICHKSFKTSLILQKHQLIHTDHKPFKCTKCPNRYRTKNEQLQHEVIHTADMPLQCAECDKRFRYRSALNAHKKIHSGVKTHICSFCSKSFLDLSNYKKHIKRMH